MNCKKGLLYKDPQFRRITKRIPAARVEAVGDGLAFYADDGSLCYYFDADLLEDFAEETFKLRHYRWHFPIDTKSQSQAGMRAT